MVHKDGGRNLEEISLQKKLFENDRQDLQSAVSKISKEIEFEKYENKHEFSFCEDDEV